MPEIRKRPQARIGICLWDLDRIDQQVKDRLLRDADGRHRLDLRREAVVRLDDEGKETCVPFACDLLDAALVCDAIRNHDRKAGEPPSRVYLRRGDSWERLPRDAVLTLVVDGVAVLNPATFAEACVEVAPPVAKRLEL